jgi:hypothetical protein
MHTTFDTVILAFGNNTGIEVPAKNLAELGGSKRAPVVVTVAGYSYKSTVGVMGGRTLISLPKAHRDAAGLKAGAAVTVTLELDEGHRTVEVPPQLQVALETSGLSGRFAELAYSKRKEFARQVAEAKTDGTRDRRIGKVLAALS